MQRLFRHSMFKSDVRASTFENWMKQTQRCLSVYTGLHVRLWGRQRGSACVTKKKKTMDHCLCVDSGGNSKQTPVGFSLPPAGICACVCVCISVIFPSHKVLLRSLRLYHRVAEPVLLLNAVTTWKSLTGVPQLQLNGLLSLKHKGLQ